MIPKRELKGVGLESARYDVSGPEILPNLKYCILKKIKMALLTLFKKWFQCKKSVDKL